MSLHVLLLYYSQTSTSDMFWSQLNCVRCRIMSDVEAPHYVRLIYCKFIYFQQTDTLGLHFEGFISLCQNSH